MIDFAGAEGHNCGVQHESANIFHLAQTEPDGVFLLIFY
jgi:hypothetical protein